MSDTIEDLKALANIHKEERQAKADINVHELNKLHIPATEQSKNVFRVDTQHGAVMYYPTSARWQHRGRTVRGTVQEFRDWLKKHHMLG